MKHYLIFLFCISFSIMAQNNLPSAQKKNKILSKFGHNRMDPYYWMNQRDSEEVLEYIGEENKHCEAYFSGLKGLVEKIDKELESRIDPNEQKSPFWYNGNLYQARNEDGLEYEKIYRLKMTKPYFSLMKTKEQKTNHFTI